MPKFDGFKLRIDIIQSTIKDAENHLNILKNNPDKFTEEQVSNILQLVSKKLENVETLAYVFLKERWTDEA